MQHDPYHYVGFSLPAARTEQAATADEMEWMLVRTVIDYFGDFQGSIPCERVQNIIKRDYPDLYNVVVMKRHGKRWHRFIDAHPEYFHLFGVYRDGQPETCWRLRLTHSTDWERADQ